MSHGSSCPPENAGFGLTQQIPAQDAPEARAGRPLGYEALIDDDRRHKTISAPPSGSAACAFSSSARFSSIPQLCSTWPMIRTSAGGNGSLEKSPASRGVCLAHRLTPALVGHCGRPCPTALRARGSSLSDREQALRRAIANAPLAIATSGKSDFGRRN